jgi:pimeloyl-ACP methyl ester carboxylesterase
LAVLLVVAGCGGHATKVATPTPTPHTSIGTGPLLVPAGRCRLAPGFKCFTLTVPLDHSGRARGELRLPVAVQPVQDAPRGVFVGLSGGPGQPGVPFAASFKRRLGKALDGYQIVTIDQRGTGGTVLRCPALQRSMGSSDIATPAPGTVEECARTLGDKRRFYTTADTVADLDMLRDALGADKLTLDGVSYGTYVAERYALAHPDRVERLVLDSVLPHANIDALSRVPMRATARVLRDACKQLRCPGDPAADLAAVIAQRHNGVELLDTLTALSIVSPAFRSAIPALREAREGRNERLDRIVAGVRRGQHTPAGFLSQGLHAATLCGDLKGPWGGPSAPLAGRRSALDAAVAKLKPAEVYPFDRATAANNGIAQTCVRWPPEKVPPLPPADAKLPAVPVLLLAGTHDLSTPMEWAQAEAKLAPKGQLVTVPGAGHGTQSRGGPVARRAVEKFLQGAGTAAGYGDGSAGEWQRARRVGCDENTITMTVNSSHPVMGAAAAVRPAALPSRR